MKVLHICSGYPDTKLYQNLIKALDDKKIQQLMYVPYNSKLINNNRVLKNSFGIEYIFSHPFNKIDRLVYYSKVKKIYKDIKKKIDLKQIKIVHAHFLFSNGGPAYEIKKELGIDYVVAVRNTDVNYFLKYGLHLRNYGIKILKEAKSVIFISPSYRNYVLENYVPTDIREEIMRKSHVIPNGIDDFWLDNIHEDKNIIDNSSIIRLISVCELNKNKNVENSIRATNFLRQKGYKVKLDIVGTGPLELKLKQLIKNTGNQDIITLHGYIKNRVDLLKLYRESDIFIMPSFQETFGLVYIEAMSQGLPVIYSKGQGIDGYFRDGEIGISVTPTNINEITEGVIQINKNKRRMYQNILKVVNAFRWSKIAEEYLKLYK